MLVEVSSARYVVCGLGVWVFRVYASWYVVGARGIWKEHDSPSSVFHVLSRGSVHASASKLCSQCVRTSLSQCEQPQYDEAWKSCTEQDVLRGNSFRSFLLYGSADLSPCSKMEVARGVGTEDQRSDHMLSPFQAAAL